MPLVRKLSRCGPEVAAIGLGTFSFSHAYGRSDSAESFRMLVKAPELDCTLIDTADSYGALEKGRLVPEEIEELDRSLH